MATFIDFCSSEEQFLDLAAFVAKYRSKGKEVVDDAFVKQAQQLLADKQSQKLLYQLIDEAQFVLTEGTEKDIEAFYYVVISLVRRELDRESSQKQISKLVGLLANKGSQDKPLLRLKILNSVYNLLDPNSIERYEVFAAILQFSRVTHHSDLLIPQFKDIDKRINEWGINTKQRRDLYKLIRDVLKDSKKSIEAHKFTTKYLSTFQGGLDNEQAAATEEAIGAILEAVRLPELYQFDELLELFPVKNLEQASPRAFQLLKIFVGDTTDSFTKFAAAPENAEFLRSHALDVSELTNKMRLLSLATLGAAAANEIPYSLVAKTLLIDESEVELWVVNAISESILDARLDQLRRVVVITRSLQRVFTKPQWKQLSESLTSWQNNVRLLLKTLGECKQQHQSLINLPTQHGLPSHQHHLSQQQHVVK